jgi:hypothetical protein
LQGISAQGLASSGGTGAGESGSGGASRAVIKDRFYIVSTKSAVIIFCSQYDPQTILSYETTETQIHVIVSV